MQTRLKRNYHWVIAVTVFFEMLVVGGVLNVMNSLFLIPITESLQISRATYGLAFSLKSVCALLSNVLSGILFVRLGYKKLTPCFLFIMAASMLLMANAQSIGAFFAACAMVGLCEGFVSVCSCAWVIGAWFHKNHGLVMGAVTSATGLGGSLFGIILATLIESSGWQTGALFCVISIAAAGLLVTLLVRSKPRDIGLLPFGEGHIGGKKAPGHHWVGYTTAQMFRTPVFYLLLLGTLLSCTCASSFSVFLTPHLQDCGMDPLSAAGVLSYLYILLAVTKFTVGTLSDKIGPKAASLICLGICPVALCLMAGISNTLTAYLSITVASLALPLTALIAPLLVPYLLGTRCSSIANGIMLAMAASGSILSNTLSNLMHDMLGSYRLYFWISAGVALCVFFLYLLMFSLSERDKKKLK